MLTVQPRFGTSYYGELFESFIIMECIKLANYYQTEFRFSYLMTEADVEVDLVVERPGNPLLLIEIKSTDDVKAEHLTALEGIARVIGENESVCFSNDKRHKKIGEVTVYPWQKGIKHFFM